MVVVKDDTIVKDTVDAEEDPWIVMNAILRIVRGAIFCVKSGRGPGAAAEQTCLYVARRYSKCLGHTARAKIFTKKTFLFMYFCSQSCNSLNVTTGIYFAHISL